ncbi:MAG: hypothetical protein J6C46_02425 [Clostridia bacterium]|nr:hypothetical protein [Clostridia bacterium]
MARLSQVFKGELRKEVLAQNEKEVLSALGSVKPIEEIPENVRMFLENQELPRVNRVVVSPFNRVTSIEGGKLFGEPKKESVFGAVSQKGDAALPNLFLYVPELSEIVQKRNKVTTVRTALKGKFGLALPQEYEAVIRDSLPDELPKEIRFEGSEARFKNLAERGGVVMHNGIVIEHTIKDASAWTFLMPGIDYKGAFANHLANVLNIDIQLAEKISANWDHSSYITVHNELYSDAQVYASNMAFHSGLASEEIIHDLLQGDVQVATNFRGKLYLDIDDELPSAVIVKGRMNVYVPPKK